MIWYDMIWFDVRFFGFFKWIEEEEKEYKHKYIYKIWLLYRIFEIKDIYMYYVKANSNPIQF